MAKKIKEPCKEISFREIYRTSDVHVIYYGWEKSRIMAFFMAIKRAFFILVVAFRILMRISPSVD